MTGIWFLYSSKYIFFAILINKVVTQVVNKEAFIFDKSKVHTVNPGNKGHLRERLNMASLDKWSLFGGNIDLF
jgi:hypothetical protein